MFTTKNQGSATWSSFRMCIVLWWPRGLTAHWDTRWDWPSPRAITPSALALGPWRAVRGTVRSGAKARGFYLQLCHQSEVKPWAILLV